MSKSIWKKTILIIDPEHNVTNGLKSILHKEGYSAVTPFDYYHLQELCEDTKPALAIINLFITKELGLNILRKIREYSPKMPIIALSVYSNSFTKKELSRLGADDFIAKPFDMKYFKEKLEGLITKRSDIV